MPRPPFSRRTFVAATTTAGLWPFLGGTGAGEAGPTSTGDDADFPRQPRELVQAVVGASHRDLDLVRELVTNRPALAKATWDWGFGDWETALGAASHTGRREIAEFLIEHGARPDLFTFAMLGNVAAVRAMIEGSPGLQAMRGPHGISLLRHARAGGARAEAVVAYLESVGGADAPLESTPLTGEQLDSYAGEYQLQTDPGGAFSIVVNGDSLQFQTEEKSKRNLRCIGAHQFAPAGGEHVRIVFEMQAGRANAVSILDGMPARRALRR